MKLFIVTVSMFFLLLKSEASGQKISQTLNIFDYLIQVCLPIKYNAVRGYKQQS